MRICIIANGFTGTTIPLAEHLHRVGYQVDIFYLLYHGTNVLDTLELDKPVKVSRYPKKISTSNSIYNYLSKDVNIYTLWVKKEGNYKKTFLGALERKLNRHIIGTFINKYIKEKYDIVNVIVYPRFMVEVCNSLKTNRIPYFMTFHEVLADLIEAKSILPFINDAIRNPVPIILHSQNTLDALLVKTEQKNIKEKCHLIHFGAFEGYLSYGNGKKCVDTENYLLFMGNILPYKGLRYLYEAIDMLDIPGLKIVVAGKGKDPILKDIKKNSRYILLNRYVHNDELVYLMRHCKAVVCPYLTASQSGVVQTAMVCGKPVIATSVGAFTEIIEDGVNGYLVKAGDAVDLSNKIQLIYRNDAILEQKIPTEYQWGKIVLDYQNLFYKEFQ